MGSDWDRDTYLLDRKPASESEAWRNRWEHRRKTALEKGEIIHQPDPEAPFGTLARYGYLLELRGNVLTAYQRACRELGLRLATPMSDRQRYAFERAYIETHLGLKEKT